MAMKLKSNGRSTSIPAGIGIGLAAALVIMVIGAMLLAWLVSTERAGENAVGWGCMVILPAASATGNFCAWSLIRHRRLLITGITTAALYVLLLILALPFGGQYEGMGLTALLVALGGGISLIPAALGSASGARGHKNRRIVKLHKNLS